MTIDHLREEIKSRISAGVESTDSVFEDAAIEQVINNKRAVVIGSLLSQSKTRKLSESWVQSIEYGCNLNPYLCEDKVVFECPSVIHINNELDGFVYVGHKNGIKPFTRLSTNYMNLSLLDSMSSRKRLMWYPEIITGTHAIVIKGNLFLEKLLIKILANDPLTVPGFRRDVDDYPVDARVADIVIEESVNSILKQIRGRTPDLVPDFTDSTAKKINR